MQEVLDQLQSRLLALFRMKLDTEDMASVDSRDKAAAIGGESHGILLIAAHHVVTVNKIEVLSDRDMTKKRRVPIADHIIPSNVRDPLMGA